jgi:hypothetical protein
MDKFDKYINDIDWNDKKENFDDVADMCNEFTKTFLEIARDSIPTKEIIVRGNDKHWFNNTLRKEITPGVTMRGRHVGFHTQNPRNPARQRPDTTRIRVKGV